MLLSIIIVSYNTEELTLQTLESVIRESQNSQLLKDKTEIWIVDNHSTDQTLRKTKELQKQTRFPIYILENRENVGFARANNQAIHQSRGELVLLLNSDTVVNPGALEHMVAIFKSQPLSETTSVLSSYKGEIDRLGILAATLLNPDGTQQAQGGSFPTLMSLTSHMLLLDDVPLLGRLLPSTQHTGRNIRPLFATSHLQAKDWVGGTAMMIKRAVFDEIGLLDERIFMYGEDIEFCLRAANHHWDCAIDSEATIIHYGSASSSSKNAIIGEMKGYRYIWSKHKPHWQIPVARVILMLGCLLRILIFGTISRNPHKVSAYQAALGQI